MVNVNCIKDSARYNVIKDILGDCHTTVYNNGKTIAVWYISEEDKKVLDEMEKVTNQY